MSESVWPHRRQPTRLLVPGILQARTLEWVAISFSNAWKWEVKVKLLSRVRPSATPWTAAHQAPPSTGFSRQEYWSGVPLPSLKALYSLHSFSYMICAIKSEAKSSFYGYLPRGRIPTMKTHLVGRALCELFFEPLHSMLFVSDTSRTVLWIIALWKDIVNKPEKAMAPHSSTLAWKIPWIEEPGGLQSMGSQRVGYDWATSLSLFTFMHWRRKWQPTLVFLPGESQGQGSLVGCRLWGRTESDTTEAT